MIYSDEFVQAILAKRVKPSIIDYIKFKQMALTDEEFVVWKVSAEGKEAYRELLFKTDLKKWLAVETAEHLERSALAWEAALAGARAEYGDERTAIRAAEREMCRCDFIPPTFTRTYTCERCGLVPVSREFEGGIDCPWCGTPHGRYMRELREDFSEYE